MRSLFAAVFAIFWKDLLGEKRTREILAATIVFALIVILIFVFAFNFSVETRRNAAAGVIWVTLCFTGTLSLNRTMAIEKDRDGMDGLLLAPMDRNAIFLGKALMNWIYVLISAAIIIPVYSIFNNLNLISIGFFGIVLLGTLGYILTGTLLVTLSIQMKTRELLLPVLLFPVIIPLILAAVNASTLLIQGGSSAELTTWILILSGYDLLFFAICIMVYEKILEE